MTDVASQQDSIVDPVPSTSFLTSGEVSNIDITPHHDTVTPHHNLSVDESELQVTSTPLSLEEDCRQLPELVVESEDSILPPPFPSGRVICDIEYVISQSRKLEEHTYNCNFNGRLVYNKMTTKGLVHTYTFVCNKTLCSRTEIIVTDKKQGCLNQLSVLAAMSTGNGFSQEEQKFSMMNMSYMSQNTYRSSEKAAGDILKSCSQKTMDAAIAKEKELASARCDIDADGFFNICVIVDGGWCKRTYGHGYNASSGVAVVIGALTQKILYISVRNKVCLICQAVAENRIPLKEHICSKNWTGPSTAMESDIIIEGLKYLEKVHNIRCTRLIGDGDTNLMKKIKENVSFGGRVLKVECANHAVRRYFRALERIQKNSSKFCGVKGIRARKFLLSRMSRLILGARAAIKQNAASNLQEPNKDKVDKLAVALLNGPAHVFGKHDACTDFCSRKMQDPDPSIYDLMQSTGVFAAVMDEVQRVLISCCGTLIFNVTNNPAEVYMSQFCKAIGGKRIDFSKGESVRRRANIAVVAFQNPAQKWQHSTYKALTGHSPGTPHQQFISRRVRRHIKRLNRKRLFSSRKRTDYVCSGGDRNYGDHPDIPDLDPESFKLKVGAHMTSIKVKVNDELEFLTRGQAACERWRYERSKRLPSTLFKDVASRKTTTLCANLVKRIIYRDNVSTKAIEYGKSHEQKAVKRYEEITGVQVQHCGLFIDPSKPFLCTSPDGLVGEDGLLEVKCPFSVKDASSLIEAFTEKNKIGFKVVDGKLSLPTNHKYYFQIQGQLSITNRAWCDLYIWIPNDSQIIHVKQNKDFWSNIIPKLEQFYIECCVPEIVDPRLPRKQPIREPSYILQAIEEKKSVINRPSKKIKLEHSIISSTDPHPIISSNISTSPDNIQVSSPPLTVTKPSISHSVSFTPDFPASPSTSYSTNIAHTIIPLPQLTNTELCILPSTTRSGRKIKLNKKYIE